MKSSRVNYAASRERAFSSKLDMLAGLLLGVICAMLLSASLALVTIASVLVTIIGVALIQRRQLEWALDQVSVDWSLPHKVRRGEIAQVRITLTNPTLLHLWGLEVAARTPEGLSFTARCDLPAQSAGELLGHLRCDHHHAGYIWGIELRAHDRLGLSSAERHVIAMRQLEISPGPPLISWRSLELAPVQTSRSNEERRSQRKRGIDGDFSELRLFQPGDGMRAVAWRPSARRGQLLTRVSEQLTERRYLFALDLSPVMRSVVGYETRVHLALDLLLSWVAQLRGEQVGVIAFDHRALFQAPIAPQANVKRYLNELSRYAAQPLDSDCVINTPEELWTRVISYLEWSGDGGSTAKSVPQLVEERLFSSPLLAVDAYQLELASAFLHQRADQSAHLLDLKLDPHAELHLLRHYCHTIGLTMTPKLPRSPERLGAGLQTVVRYAHQQRATHLICLTHAHRARSSAPGLSALGRWARGRGVLGWIDIGARSTQRPETLQSVPMKYMPLKLKSTQQVMSNTGSVNDTVNFTSLRRPPWTWSAPERSG